MSKEVSKRLFDKACDFQVKIKIEVELPRSWFVAELYQEWNKVDGEYFYRYPASSCVCRLESTRLQRNAIGKGATLAEALSAAIEIAQEIESEA